MPESIVINTGPLIILSRIDALQIPADMPLSFICPQEVRQELDEGEQAGYPQISPDWLRVVPIKEPLSRLLSVSLDSGEAAVIQLALERNIRWVCIDEWKGRRAALSAGLLVTGVLGLLSWAKKQSIIPVVKPYIERALAEGVHYDATLVNQILHAVGEEWP